MQEKVLALANADVLRARRGPVDLRTTPIGRPSLQTRAGGVLPAEAPGGTAAGSRFSARARVPGAAPLARASSCDETHFLQSATPRYAYPVDLFPSFWKGLEERIALGQVIASEVVRDELDQKDDDLKSWVRKHPKLIAPMDDVQQQIVAVTVARHPSWFDARSTRNNADPFVIALAKSRSIAVVSDEGVGSSKNPSIPYVCKEAGVRHVSILDYIRETKLRFETAH